MRMHPIIAAAAGALMASVALTQAASAHLLITVDQTAQRMLVSVDGQLLHVWPVSTGRPGYETPDGAFTPVRMDIDHQSNEYEDAPMPYSIFFTGNGVAVHGTNEQGALGRPVSHGCVRLSVDNAATLWTLVEQQTMANTTVVVTGTTPAARRQMVAQSAPMVLTPPVDVGTPQPQPLRDQQRPGLFGLFFGG